jgi:protocatechuate 3,4-dioxygenase beta subunit
MYDYNKNGLQDKLADGITNELASDSVMVYLYNGANSLLDSILTDANGYYYFTNLVPGDYYIKSVGEKNLPNFSLTKSLASNLTINSDIDTTTFRSITTNLVSGENDSTWDIGSYLKPNAILDPCKCKNNATNSLNGQYDETIEITGTPGSIWQIIAQTGMYQSGSLQPPASPSPVAVGTIIPLVSKGKWLYNFVHIDSIGYSITVTNGIDTLKINNACLYPNVNFTPFDTVLCLYDDPFPISSSPNIPGTVIYTLSKGTDTNVVTTINPLLLGEGDYHLEALFIPTDPSKCNDRFLFDFKIGITNNCLASIGNYVWLDANKDGLRNFPEVGVSGITVTLLNNANNTISSTVTDAYGYYKFSNLVPANYKVKFTAPADYTFTNSIVPGDNSNDFNSDANTLGSNQQFTSFYTLSRAEYDSTADAGIIPIVRTGQNVGNYVWIDNNKNGLQDVTEPGVSGVVVTLYSATNSIISATVTNDNGYYLFTNVPAGQYTIRFNLQVATIFTSNNGTIGVADNSDANVRNGFTQQFQVIAGQDNLTIDAGIILQDPVKASVGDRVWNDLNINGNQDDFEPGIEGVVVKLVNGNGAIIDSTTTNIFGNYLFNNLDTGVYQILFGTPNGYASSPYSSPIDSITNSDNLNGQSYAFTLSPGEKKMTVDAGFYLTNQAANLLLGDYVWYDTDFDGIQDATEPGVVGATVQLLNSANVVIATTATDVHGQYLFPNLSVGNYKVQFSNLPDGYILTQKEPSASNVGSDANATGITDNIYLTADNLSIDAGIIAGAPGNALGSIGDRVWFDINKDGEQQNTEFGVPGITVNLIGSTGAIIGTQVTNALGNYLFTGLLPSDYIVQFSNLPIGYVGSPTTFTNTTLNSDGIQTTGNSGIYATPVVSLGLGENRMDIDQGIFNSNQNNNAALGNFVWHDVNFNGVQDPGEPGVPGISVTLLGSNNLPLASTTTNADGGYLFAGLEPGNYKVEFSNLPTGFLFNLPNQISDTTLDANQNINGVTTLITIANNQYNPTIDAGIFNPATGSLGGRIWNDINSNGLKEVNELPTSGLLVLLLDSTNKPVSSAVTDGNGLFLFINLTPNVYTVIYTKPNGTVWSVNTTPGSNQGIPNDNNVIDSTQKSSPVPIAAGTHVRFVDAGYSALPNASVGNFVWNDFNINGIQDADEYGVAGVTVNLVNANGAIKRTAITDGNGFYLFKEVEPYQAFTIQFTNLPIGGIFTTEGLGTPSNGSDANVVTGFTQPFTLAAGEYNPNIDAGIILSAAIGSYVWNDKNNDGIWQQNETPIPNVTIFVYDSLGTTLVATGKSDSIGLWKILVPGNQVYVVKIDTTTLPTAFHLSDVNNVGNDAIDNDGPRNTSTSPPIFIEAGTYNSTVWFGALNNSPLALTMELKGTIYGAVNLLDWKVYDQSDVIDYHLQKLVNNVYKTIEIKAATTATSTTFKSTDADVHNVDMYRVMANLKDGNIQFSNEVVLNRKSNSQVLQVFPNPTYGLATIQFTADNEAAICVKVMDVAGRVVRNVYASATQGINAIQVDMRSTAAGTYYIQLFIDEEKVGTSRIIKKD